MDISSREATSMKLIHIVRGCSYSAFFLVFWEWLTTLNFETRVIWRKSTDKRIRWAYCTSRYVGLAALAINISVVSFVQFIHFNTERHCQIWYGFQLTASTVLLFSMNYNLIYRLRALYKGSRYMSRILIAGASIEAIAVFACGGWSIASLTFSSDGGCLPMHAPPQVLYLTIAQMVSQIAIGILTSFKSLRLYLQSGWMEMPLLSLIARDGLAVFMLFTALLAAMLWDAIHREPGNHTAQLCYFIFPLYVTLLSVSIASLAICSNSKLGAALLQDARTWHQRGGPLLATGYVPALIILSLRICRAFRHVHRLSNASTRCSIAKQPTLHIQRNISTTIPRFAALANSLPTQPTVVLHSPSPEYIEKEELDVDLLPPEQVKLEITDRAAEQLMKIAEREKNQDAALRIAVESGGCHGYQYKMDLAKSRSPDDYQFSHPSIKPSNILVDAVSLSLLNGSTIDFATELIGSSFRVAHNPQAKGSGCGCGVSWELKE